MNKSRKVLTLVVGLILGLATSSVATPVLASTNSVEAVRTQSSKGFVHHIWYGSSKAYASENSTDSFQTIQRFPLTKRIRGVKRLGPWHNSAATVVVDTPWEIPYNDGTYNGYLHRETMYQEFRNNKIRWVVYYGGTVRLRSHGAIIPYKNKVQE